MLAELFSSRVRAKILISFFLSPGIGQNAWELSGRMDENYSAVWKELVHLEKMGILNSRPQGKAKMYAVNLDCPIVNELRSIVLKTEGVGNVIRDKLKEMSGVKTAFIFGSFASGEADERSDLDLMIIGEVDLERFSPVISGLEKTLTRPINYVIFSEEEWIEKQRKHDPFVENLLQARKIYLLGEEHAL